MKKLTKVEKKILISYKNATIENLYHCYKNPSNAKISSFEEILREMWSVDGYSIKILSHNSHMYTCAYLTDDALVYHTPSKRVVIPLDYSDDDLLDIIF